MTQQIILSWQADNPEETISSGDGLISRLVEIAGDTTPENGLAAIIRKPNGQEMTVVMAGPYWWLDWFPEDYLLRGCVGSHHTVATDTNVDEEGKILTFYMHGHHGECLAEHTIETDEALEAIRSFLMSSEKPDCVTWEID